MGRTIATDWYQRNIGATSLWFDTSIALEVRHPMSIGSRALPRLAAAAVFCLIAAGCGSGDEDTAAGMTWTATQCAFPEGDPLGEDAPDHLHSVALVGTGVFLTGQDGEDADDLLKFQFDGAEGCTLTPDAAFGSNGVLDFEDGVEYLTASDTGLVMASHQIFDTWVVDAKTGALTDCGPGGNRVDLAPDGTLAWDHFPGSNELDRVDIADGTCAITADALALTTQQNMTAGGWIDDNTYIVGGFLEEGAGVTRLDRSGSEGWQAGGSALDADTGFGTISGVAPCGGYACIVDSNFRELHILDPADGSQLGLLDLQELVGLGILWFNDIAEADDGAVWLVGGLAQQLPDGESSEIIQGLVYRVELS